MKIIQFNDGDKVDQALASVIDAALKFGGMQSYPAALFLLSSIRVEATAANEEETKEEA